MAFIEAGDFVGEFKLPNDTFNQAITQNTINLLTNSTIKNILGVSLGNDVITYIGNNQTPSNTELNAIINPFQLDIDCGVLESKGLKYAVMGQIYFSRQNGLKVQQNNISGTSAPTVENGTNTQFVPSIVYEKVNNTVSTIHAIQNYCLMNSDVYPTYNGQRFYFESLL